MEHRKNDIVVIKIKDVGTEGQGIGKADGYTVFVKDTVPGDTVEAKIVKPKKNYAYGRLEKVLSPSPFRVEPKCAFHRQCGGCQMQAYAYEEQLAFKQNKVRSNLIRIGGFKESLIDCIMEPIIGMDDYFHYRNKAQFPIGYDKEGNPVAGFYAGRTHSIISNTDCALGVRENKVILEHILNFMKENRISAYNEVTGEGLVRHVLIRKGFTSGEIMVCLVINGKRLPHCEKLVGALTGIPNMTSISISVNMENTNVIMGKEIINLWGSNAIEDTIHLLKLENGEFQKTDKSVKYSISPLSFYQVNPIQTEKLYSTALEFAGLTGTEIVWDLYCGIGTISLFLAQNAKYVYGVEVVGEAVKDAKENANKNGIVNAEFFEGKAEEILPDKYKEEGILADIIVVDPPRKGCDEKCLETILKMQPKKIVYISCDSATLARDLRILCEGGYEMKRIRATDMFPHTVHVETVVLLSRKKPDAIIDIEITTSELDLTRAESKATYEEIKR